MYDPHSVSKSIKFVFQSRYYVAQCILLLKMLQVLDWLFKSCEVNGMEFLNDGLINVKDIEECVVKGDCKKLGTALPAWCILKCLLASAKSDAPGLVVCMFLTSCRCSAILMFVP